MWTVWVMQLENSSRESCKSMASNTLDPAQTLWETILAFYKSGGKTVIDSLAGAFRHVWNTGKFCRCDIVWSERYYCFDDNRLLMICATHMLVKMPRSSWSPFTSCAQQHRLNMIVLTNCVVRESCMERLFAGSRRAWSSLSDIIFVPLAKKYSTVHHNIVWSSPLFCLDQMCRFCAAHLIHCSIAST